MLVPGLLSAWWLAAGCVPPPEAPEELDGISHYLYEHQADEDADVPAAGLVNLEAWLVGNAGEGEGFTQDTPFGQRAWSTITPLEEEEVAGLPERPDRPLDNLLGSAVAGISPHPVGCHAAVQLLSDQLPVEPTAETYVRSFPEEPTPSCFLDGSCEQLVTVNDARRGNFIFSADFILYKNYRWFEYELDDGTPRRAFYSRSWFDQSWESDDGPGGNQLWQSYSVDVWIDRGDGTTIRYQVLWSESELYLAGILVGDNEQLATVSTSTEGIFAKTDTFIAETLQPAGDCGTGPERQ